MGTSLFDHLMTSAQLFFAGAWAGIWHKGVLYGVIACSLGLAFGSQFLAIVPVVGDVLVKFFIAPDGSVQASSGTGFDAKVASCVADVVHAINFPAPKDGGGVTVNYPFHFHTASAQ